jgi:hypothetical protein
LPSSRNGPCQRWSLCWTEQHLVSLV